MNWHLCQPHFKFKPFLHIFTFVTIFMGLCNASSITGVNFDILVNARPDGGTIISSNYTRTVLGCLSQCVRHPFCGTAMWKRPTDNCVLLGEYQSELNFTPDSDTDAYSRSNPCDQYSLYDKAAWGAVSATSNPNNLEVPVSYVVIHHTALSRDDGWPTDCGDLESCKSSMRDIQYYDMNMRSSAWLDIAVNFFVDGSGRFYEGRGWSVNAAYKSVTSRGGVEGYGKHVALTVFGDYRFERPSLATRVSLRAFCACAVERGLITKQYTVLGHVEDKSFSSYICPGAAMLDMVHDWPLL